MGANNSLVVKVDLQGFAFETGMDFRGLTISKREDGWNFVIRATDKDGTDLYCIEQKESLDVAFEDLWGVVCSKDAKYFWRLDSWSR